MNDRSLQPGKLTLRQRSPDRQSLSNILEELPAFIVDQKVSIAMLLECLGDRALAVMIVLFALPNVLPMPPGTSGILGVPLVFLAAQLMLGSSPWLPGFIANRAIKKETFESLIGRCGPSISRLEHVLRPRFSWLEIRKVEFLIGGFCLILSIILLLPIPLGNLLPALSIVLIGMGVLERDGLWILIGFVVGCVSLVVVVGVIAGLLKTAFLIFGNLFD